MADAPWSVIWMVERARIILGLQERGYGFRPPPRRLWLDDKRLSEYIEREDERVRRAMKGEEDEWDPERVDGPAETQDVAAMIFSEDAPAE